MKLLVVSESLDSDRSTQWIWTPKIRVFFREGLSVILTSYIFGKSLHPGETRFASIIHTTKQ